MTTWKNKTRMQKRVIITYLAASIPFMLAGMALMAAAYAKLFAIGPDDPLSIIHLAGLLLFMITGLLVGLVAGGWVWLVLARFMLRYYRHDIEDMLADGPQINMATRYNSWCLDLVFGKCSPHDADGNQETEHQS